MQLFYESINLIVIKKKFHAWMDILTRMGAKFSRNRNIWQCIETSMNCNYFIKTVIKKAL